MNCNPSDDQKETNPLVLREWEGIVTEEFGGRFARFHPKERVIVRDFCDGTSSVERKTWRQPEVSLCNVACGVPSGELRVKAGNNDEKK